MIPPTIHIDAANIEAFVPVFVDAFNAPPWCNGWSLEAARERLIAFAAFPRFMGIGLLHHAAPAALALGWGERWTSGWVFHLKEMCVSPQLQGAGLGRQLLDALERKVEAEGCVSVYLETAAVAPAREFYVRMGYQALDLVTLRKPLNGHRSSNGGASASRA